MRMKHRRKLVVGLGAAVFSLGMVVTAGSAQAGTNGTDYVYAGGSPVGKVWFNSDGDIFTVYDWKADSHGVAVWYRVGDSSAKVLVNNNGYNSSKTFNLDFPEGATVKFMACTTEQSVVWDCDGTWSTSPFPGVTAKA
ncbi:hypothetical protein [Yinghuangia aomiensis]|uniref:hypothetical protein n=1 Tax=Yinghuangia aomiensis TaxID=676205 RepID=UPI0031E75813